MNINIASDSLYSAISGASLLFGNFLSGVLVANSLGVADTGTFYLFVAISTLLATVLDGGCSSSVVRFQASLRGQDHGAAAYAMAGSLARRLFLYILLGLSLLAGLMVAGGDYLTSSLPPLGETLLDSVGLHLVLASAVCIQAAAMFAVAYLRGTRRFRKLAGLSFFSMAVQLTLVGSSVPAIGVMGAIIGYGLGQIALAIITVGLVFRGGNVPRALRTEVGHYQRFAWAANVCNIFVWSRIEIFILQDFWGAHEVGLFSVALALSALASQGPMLMTGAFLPLLSERHGRGDTAGLQRAFAAGTRLLAMVAFPACMSMVAFLPALVELIYGRPFAAAVPASMIACTVAAISVTAVIGTHLVSALARSDFIFYSSLLGAFLSITLGLAIIPPFGILGAAAARSLTQFIMVAVGVWFLTSRLQFSYPFIELLRLFAATLPATFVSWTTVELIGGVPGLIVAATLFLPLYLAGLRVVSAVPASDIELLQGLGRRLPGIPAQLVQRVLLAIGSTRTTQRNTEPAE